MRDLLVFFPMQVEEAIGKARRLSLSVPDGRNHVVVAGMGGSAIGGDILGALLVKSMRVPFVVNRDYHLPGFVDSSSLIFACSYSGNTEETLSAYHEAKRAGASLVCISSGGELARLAVADGYSWIQIPAGMPPRAALGHASIALLSSLQALGLAPDMTEPLEETAALLSELALQYGPDSAESDNAAKQLARCLHGKVVAIYASSEILGPIALRWRGQIEENAKNLAFHHTLPEMNHNELVGWELPEPVLSQIGVVLLRDREDHPQVQRRFDLTRELIRKRAGLVKEIWTSGRSLLARLFSTAYLGDFVSLYLAYLNSVDPTPVAVIETLKKELSR
jgi:glucose/mannose-6-phosphate isomerase